MYTTKMNDVACMAAGIQPKKIWVVRRYNGEHSYDTSSKEDAERWLTMMRKNAGDTSPIHSSRIEEEDSFPDLERDERLATEALKAFITKKQIVAHIIVQENLIAITLNGEWVCTSQTVGNAVIQFICYVVLYGLMVDKANYDFRKGKTPCE